MSALDGDTASKVYDQLLSSRGLLKGTTRIIATHYNDLIAEADIVIELQNGAIKSVGPGRGVFIQERPLSNHRDDKLCSTDAFPGQIRENNLSDNDLPAEKWLYVREGGLKGCALGVTLVVFSAAAYTFSNVWLSIWSAQDEKDQEQTGTTNIAIYSTMGLIQAIFSLLGCLAIYNFSITASRNLHDIMALKILNGEITGLNRIGVGQLLNVVSKDFDILESIFPQNLQATILNFLLLLSAIFTTC
ncbi:Multidrug resistance-associated protein 6 [Folsomia candida]|uniref:Multidrug resistance-associated protein 6 n=1 Tax=Folsomia candida TaxID=158441 RepID=A0A226DEV3_FOLCA|nr:Multidrug resistance-associated protein 6 [Folsomia candida]